MSVQSASPRLLFLLDTVCSKGRHLLTTTGRLLPHAVDEEWVVNLENDENLAERLDAFVARFSRMQDAIGDKLIPELRKNLLEESGAALDNLNRMEKLGLVKSVTDLVEARNLSNQLVHEYMRDAAQFAQALNRTRELVPMLVETYNALNRYAKSQLGTGAKTWPADLDLRTLPQT